MIQRISMTVDGVTVAVEYDTQGNVPLGQVVRSLRKTLDYLDRLRVAERAVSDAAHDLTSTAIIAEMKGNDSLSKARRASAEAEIPALAQALAEAQARLAALEEGDE